MLLRAHEFGVRQQIVINAAFHPRGSNYLHQRQREIFLACPSPSCTISNIVNARICHNLRELINKWQTIVGIIRGKFFLGRSVFLTYHQIIAQGGAQ